MADVSAALVKELRDKTAAGMMDCKRALAECAGNLEAAVDWLRKKGLSQAAKKAGRVTAEGLIGVAVKGRRAAMVEVNSETDFVARNRSFQDFVRTLAELALDHPGDAEALASVPYPGAGKPVRERLTELIATVGENMALRRVVGIEVPSGLVGSYVHAALAPGLGKIGVLVGIEAAATGEPLETLGKQLAMHVAAANPQVVSRQEVDPADIERERRVLLEQAKEAGKPAAVAEKMVEGRLRRFYEENCLIEQTFVVDEKTRVGQVLEEAAKRLGSPVQVKRFARFALGEGVAKKSDSFANDVAAALKS